MTDDRQLTCTLAIADPHHVRITVSGELGYDSADELLRMVAGLLTDDPPQRIHVDCAGLGFCDSYGLSTLLTIHRRTRAVSTVLSLDNRSEQLDRLLQLTGTLELLTGAVPEERRRNVERRASDR